MNKLVAAAVLSILLLLFHPCAVWTREPESEFKPDLHAQSAILMDYDTGTILYEKNPDMIIPPASLTKLVTLYVVYTMAENGMVHIEDSVEIPEQAWYVNMPRGSSLMFLGPDMDVTVRDLMLGLSVSSGNDAAEALALHISGSIEDFAALMNSEMEKLGLEGLRFTEPAGLSDKNSITAREFAEFCRFYMLHFPQALQDLHAVREFTFPKEPFSVNGGRIDPITQKNRNTLLWTMEGVDGLKTGYIDESGYNLAVTARNNGMRLIGIVLGIQAADHLQGGELRSRDGRILLEYGFSNFATVKPRNISFPRIRVWKGISETLVIGPSEEVVVTVPVEDLTRLASEMELDPFIEAPVMRGEQVGNLHVLAGRRRVATFPLVAREDVERAGLLGEIWDGLLLFIEKRKYAKEKTRSRGKPDSKAGSF